MPRSAKKPRLSSASQRDSLTATGSARSSSIFGSSVNGAAPANDVTPTKDDGKKINWSTVGPDFEFKIKVHHPHASKKRKRLTNATTPVPSKGHFTDSLSIIYSITPAAHWESTSKFRKFTIAAESFQLGDIVYIKPSDAAAPSWLAKVLEVRAGDEQHVYIRVFWLYRPEELPGGRRPYHGKNELVASNDMQIVDAMTVDGKADVKHWVEDDEAEEVLDADQMFWRQTWDAHRGVLSQPREHCICHRPFNPDRLLIACSNPDCKIWMHAECLAQDAVERAHMAEGLPPPKFDQDGPADAAAANSVNGTASASHTHTTPQSTKKRGRPRKSKDADDSAGPIEPAFKAELVTKTPDSSQEDSKKGILNSILHPAGTEKKSKIVVTDVREGGGGASFEEPVRCLACGEEVV